MRPAARPAAPSASRRKPTPRCCRSRSRRRCVPLRRGFPWGAVFWSAVGGLVLLGVGLSVTQLIEDLFARSEGLGFLGLAFALAAALAFAVVVAREAFGLDAPGDDRKAASARDRGSAERRSQRKPRHRPGADKTCASEPASGAGPRRAAGPCRRYHRRRRHDPAGRARIDDAARSGGAPPGVVGGAARSRSSPRSARALWSTCFLCSWPRCG